MLSIIRAFAGVHLRQAVGPDLRARRRNGRLHRHRVHGMEEAAVLGC